MKQESELIVISSVWIDVNRNNQGSNSRYPRQRSVARQDPIYKVIERPISIAKQMCVIELRVDL
jgi:hypothetical protein